VRASGRSADGCPVKADIRLNVMTNPFRDVRDGAAHVPRPIIDSDSAVFKVHVIAAQSEQFSCA
jgi:hypothetical protein